ncbi:general secretion pathway protein M [Natronocella acetinitrilica]|uniref:Type II secretion system protein M n=1 Tax=Natronocella acetinitrilica TaxID=414046 RepID=A0AAE3K9S7_9GAMM|nr:type II secretion system protein M [Natronocella acetinitrilica]MCP1673040.1 general secretion pathway protein M [Natronocella acetinitrilica]
MSGLKRWWTGLSSREQRTVSYGGAALALILFFFLVWQPIHERTDTLQATLAERQELLVYLESARQRLGAQPIAEGEEPRSAGQALFALADQSARQAGLQQVLRSVEPSGQAAARVQFENIAFDDLMRWLGTLRDRHGVIATTVSLRRTDIEGRVDVQLVLESS